MLTKAQIREKAVKLGIDLIGFAEASRFVSLPPEKNPLSIFAECKTVILIGRRIPRGALRGAAEGTTFASYGNFGYKLLDDQFVATSTYDMVRFIEDDGWEACPIFPNPDAINNMGVPVEPGKPAPNVTPDFNFAAVACGLGEIGDNGIFLSPELGPRVRFQMILTDLELENDPPFEGSICDHCGACAAACPLKALDLSAKRELNLDGKTFVCGTYDNELCRACLNGGTPNRLHPKGDPDRMAAACTRACIRHLAEKGVGAMNAAFVPQKEWAKDRAGRIL